LDEKYDVSLALALSHSFLGDDARAAQHLSEARAFREQMKGTWQKADSFDVFYGEVITLGSLGRWAQAKRLMNEYDKNSARTPLPYDALMLFCDGPPFAGVTSALQPFAGKPYVGMLALLANRVVEKWSAPTKERLLTAAEADILRLIGLGKSNKDIASTRSRSIETVKRQVASLYRKLGVESRTSAVAVGRERGLL
jgi:DNA-binding CsgD family transcriptional regulator